MPLKILSVDDSKTVRIIVRKALKAYDCTLLEAQNGVEGLAVAGAEKPDLILLDVTMPVMDGVEMLTKLKEDAKLKPIPVIMLTAEAGRENIMKIAKLGIRDYIVKPFKEEVLIEKIGRVLTLNPKEEAAAPKKGDNDPRDVLLVEDKPAIVKMITEGLDKATWKITVAESSEQAVELCHKLIPDVFVVSLSLPDDSAIKLLRTLRSDPRVKEAPVLGLSVKTALDEQQRAMQAGFTSIITKPIDFGEMESRMARAAHIDMTAKFFSLQSDHFLVRLPSGLTVGSMSDVNKHLKTKLPQAVDSGIGNVVIDLKSVKDLDSDMIKFLMHAMDACADLGLKHVLIGNEDVISASKNFDESKDWTFYSEFSEAKAALV